MRDLILVPLEPLTERYTEQWYRNFPKAFANEFNVITVDGNPLIEDDIKVGSFLDINSTTHYKWSQLQQISKMFHQGNVADGTVFFFSDIEFWGLEAVRLLADMNGVKVKLAGFLHAASYTIEDAFAIAAPYQRFTEVGWVAALDAVYVGSEYHKNAFVERRLKPLGAENLAGRIHVTGNPVFKEEYPDFKAEKENIVLLTNRFDSEKRPGETLQVFAQLKKKYPSWRFVVCTGRSEFRSNDPELVEYARKLERDGVVEIHAGLSKHAYHNLLARAKVMVSHSIEENFGYSLIEALHYNCVPVVRKGLSHSEILQFDDALLFEDTGASKVEDAMFVSKAACCPEYIAPYYTSLNKITQHLVSL